MCRVFPSRGSLTTTVLVAANFDKAPSCNCIVFLLSSSAGIREIGRASTMGEKVLTVRFMKQQKKDQYKGQLQLQYLAEK